MQRRAPLARQSEQSLEVIEINDCRQLTFLEKRQIRDCHLLRRTSRSVSL
jgi:hypothetical protein